MVLSYRSPYRLRVSRVVIEAIMHGIPVITTTGTTLFEQVEEFGEVVGCEHGNAKSLAEAIFQSFIKSTEWDVATQTKKNVARKHFSISNFQKLFQSNLCLVLK
jgi:glycosyltransferase involved in cell wall biosynthesis